MCIRDRYLDAAWWTKAGDHQWLSRFQQGHVWKLHGESAQTLMVYGFGEFSTQDPDTAVSYTHLDVYKRQAHRPSHWHLQFHETRLTLDSAALADGCDGLRLHQ